jgi:hypothetical protein
VASSESKTTGSKGPLSSLEQEVAMALCQQSITGGAWPNKDAMDRVQREWRNHLADARVAIRAIGGAFIKGIGNDA